MSTQVPGYVAGTWDIDPVHSDVSFTVRHMMVSKVREIITRADPGGVHGQRDDKYCGAALLTLNVSGAPR